MKGQGKIERYEGWRMMAKKIPIFIIEEHNEAFFVWSYFKKRNRALTDVLFHIDEHSDLACTRVDRPFRELKRAGDQALWDFTVDNIGIDTFITAAFHEGIVRTCHWVKNVEMQSYVEKYFVACEDEEQARLVMYKATEANREAFFMFNEVEVQIHGGPEGLPTERSVLLDIDIDYFSSNVKPENFDISLQVTKREYDAFNSTPYHPLRLLHTQVRAEKRGSSYYLHIYKYAKPLPSPRRTPACDIEKNLRKLMECLSRKKIVPELITLCRSRFSNYTPQDQWEYIESSVLTELEKMYDTRKYYLPDFLKEKEIKVSQS
jgi:hypothetical protein